MPQTIKVRKFGGSFGIILPKNIAEAMAIQDDDELYVSETPDGISITPYDPDFADALEDARAFMRTHRDAFRALAE